MVARAACEAADSVGRVDEVSEGAAIDEAIERTSTVAEGDAALQRGRAQALRGEVGEMEVLPPPIEEGRACRLAILDPGISMSTDPETADGRLHSLEGGGRGPCGNILVPAHAGG